MKLAKAVYFGGWIGRSEAGIQRCIKHAAKALKEKRHNDYAFWIDLAASHRRSRNNWVWLFKHAMPRD